MRAAPILLLAGALIAPVAAVAVAAVAVAPAASAEPACPPLAWHVPPATPGAPAGPSAFAMPTLPAHPRLFLTPAREAAIRRAIDDVPAMRETWTRQFLPLAKTIVETDPAKAYRFVPKTSCTDDQEWMRRIADSLPVLAFAYRVTRDPIYLDGSAAGAQHAQFGLRQYLAVILGDALPWSPAGGYASWGNNEDLAAASLLTGLGLAYDWTKDALPPATAQAVRAALLYHGAIMYDAALGRYVADTMGAPPTWSAGDFLQGHLFVNVNGLLTAALALAGPEMGADPAVLGRWAGAALADLKTSILYLGPRAGHQPDGASQEGASYAGYALEEIMRSAALSDELLATTFLGPASPAAAWFADAPAYAIYLSLPRNAWQPVSGARREPGLTAISLGDNPSRFSRGPDYLMRKLAALHPAGAYSRYAQGFADLALGRGIDGGDRLTWLNFIWNDPALPKADLAGLPTLHQFENFGFVSTRRDWSGDESLVFFIAGPPIGRTNFANPDVYGSMSHVHPYQNSVVVFGQGQYILRSVGYETPKLTQNENTLRIGGSAAPGVDGAGRPAANGIGQLGEGATWFDGARAGPLVDATMQVVHSDRTLDYLLGDATTAYPPASGLALYRRSLVYLKPLDTVLVVDDVRMKPGTVAGSVELDFHPGPDLAADPGTPGLYVTPAQPRQPARLRIQFFDPQAHVAQYDNPYSPENGKPPYPTLPTLTVQRQKITDWQNATAISWGGQDAAPIDVAATRTGPDLWSFAVTRNRKPVGTLVLDIGTRSPSADWKPSPPPPSLSP